MQLLVSGEVKEIKKDLESSSSRQEYSHVVLFSSWGVGVGCRIGRRGETLGGGAFEQG